MSRMSDVNQHIPWECTQFCAVCSDNSSCLPIGDKHHGILGAASVRCIKHKSIRVRIPEIILIMYIYHALINALSAHMVHINLNMIIYTHVEHSPTETIYIRY